MLSCSQPLCTRHRQGRTNSPSEPQQRRGILAGVFASLGEASLGRHSNIAPPPGGSAHNCCMSLRKFSTVSSRRDSMGYASLMRTLAIFRNFTRAAGTVTGRTLQKALAQRVTHRRVVHRKIQSGIPHRMIEKPPTSKQLPNVALTSVYLS